jgi:hypothetical protein
LRVIEAGAIDCAELERVVVPGQDQPHFGAQREEQVVAGIGFVEDDGVPARCDFEFREQNEGTEAPAKLDVGFHVVELADTTVFTRDRLDPEIPGVVAGRWIGEGAPVGFEWPEAVARRQIACDDIRVRWRRQGGKQDGLEAGWLGVGGGRRPRLDECLDRNGWISTDRSICASRRWPA